MKSDVDKKPPWKSCSRRNFMKATAMAAGAIEWPVQLGPMVWEWPKWHLLRRNLIEEPV